MITIEGLRYENDPGEFAAAMLCGVEYEMSALVCFDRSGACTGVRQFDTRYRALPPADGAARAWLLSNHPTDCGVRFEEDERNLQALAAQLGEGNVRFVMTCQTGVCRQDGAAALVIF